ncbi:lipoate--protein ligase family protein [Halobacillus karajensis]|uniref:Octanoyl-[GcvH]:protein N-octanoyltransferase n=1 Tax=Halobacillus karajensis TaxID=195088 RepID=A0A024P3C0_9BACI|nr:lipoate--protein ligase family protein [Halobacillus karajensis]CDQ18779.1 Octanoyl-[GcvH]:protein N-octanoyltransferase [Halobacillus karajensis]CDQ23149.1 Octanoyl-[GcvH]:protein N-octanoyltransferase [Halobacillus karajensis]CDQ26631.1 Octanoyl-[GcvH]:protein N-octanoyltransferase [Halobacillus karajensis]
MNELHPLLKPDTYRFIDQSNLGPGFSALQSFAMDDALSISVGERISPTTARLWVHHDTIVLGIPDARLPYIKEGIEFLRSNGYDIVVRNSGGLAVVLDKGVLNLSLIFPDSKQVNIHEGYEAMVSFIQHLFSDLTDGIEAYEITQSYCPGTYDLSINGKKFAGISQRRVKNGSAVQIYLDVSGSGAERASLLKRFYEIGKQGEDTRFTYPHIEPNVMASLNELLNTTLSVLDVSDRILMKLHELSGNLITHALDGKEIDWFHKRFDQMIKRNEKALDNLE